MSLILIHNPRCSKSRATLQILEDSKKEFTIRDYLHNPLKKDELLNLVKELELSPIDIIRTKESLVAENSLDLSNDESCLEALVKFPKIMQRPIVSNGHKTIICRPPENVRELL